MLLMAGAIFGLLSIVAPEDGRTRADEVRNGTFSTIAFAVGGLTSILSGYLGMQIATYANARTSLEARRGIAPAFMAAFRSGAVMGFLLAGFGLLNLFVVIQVFSRFYGDDWKGLYEAITGYGLGGSSIALFGRVGGGIYTKAADVGADLVGKVEKDIPEDDPRNPAVIAGEYSLWGWLLSVCVWRAEERERKREKEKPRNRRPAPRVRTATKATPPP